MIAVIVLAAGEARRMGQPKQLMKLRGKSLLRRAVQTAQAVGDEVVVVTGAYSDKVQREVAASGVHVVNNNQWQSGMGSSIRTGLEEVLRQQPATEAVIITLCDQPLVSASLLQQIIKLYRRSSENLVVCAYNGILGVPALFGNALFPDLLKLSGKEGAKKVIARHATHSATIDFPEGAYDVDTPQDFERIQKLLAE